MDRGVMAERCLPSIADSDTHGRPPSPCRGAKADLSDGAVRRREEPDLPDEAASGDKELDAAFQPQSTNALSPTTVCLLFR